MRSDNGSFPYHTTGASPALGVTNHAWTITKLVDADLNGVVNGKPQGRKVGRFTVIDGGNG
jgi:hypothetical protein